MECPSSFLLQWLLQGGKRHILVSDLGHRKLQGHNPQRHFNEHLGRGEDLGRGNRSGPPPSVNIPQHRGRAPAAATTRPFSLVGTDTIFTGSCLVDMIPSYSEAWVAVAGASRGWGRRIDVCRGGNTCDGYLGASASIAAESGRTPVVTRWCACGGYLDASASIMGGACAAWVKRAHRVCAAGDDDTAKVTVGME